MMNEQNITNIIEYLDQNPDQTIEVLVQNLLNEGYPVEDVKAALDRQGISPLVIPGYRETIVYNSPKRSHWFIVLIIVVILLSIIIAVVVYAFATGYFDRRSVIGDSPTSQNSPPPSGNNTISATVNPVPDMRNTLQKDDYKIISNQVTVYLDNGEIARLEKGEGRTYLDWSGIVTIIDNTARNYKTYFAQTPEAQEYQRIKNVGIVPLEVIADTEAGKIQWKKVSDTVLESTNIPKQQIIIDPQTKLVVSRISLNPDGSISKEEQVAYEKTAITADLLKIPTGYTVLP